MTPSSLSARADLASKLARDGGRLALDYYKRRDTLEIEAKTGALDLVSIADRAVEDLIRAGISAAFPDDAILGEEGGASAGTSGLTWIIDPIDGTVPFLTGLPHWCVVIAIAQGPRTVVGAIEVPVIDEHFAAIAGQGATMNGTPLTLDASKRIDEAVIAVGASERAERAQIVKMIDGLLEKGSMYYRNGSGANMLANVAAGRLGGYVEPEMMPWDRLAGLLMIDEAGGVTHPYRADQIGGLTLAAAPGIWPELKALASDIF